MAKEEAKEVVKYIEVERKQAAPVKMDVWTSAPKSEWQYVTIPKEDLHGYPYPQVSVNQDKFNELGPVECADGKVRNLPIHPSFVGEENGQYKFLVPPILAGEIKRIVDRHQVELVALMQPRKRLEALRALAHHPGSAKTPGADSIPGAANPA